MNTEEIESQNGDLHPVYLHVYDLSNGIAEKFSSGRIKGVWHSTVNVHDREYYISGGICYDIPHKTKYGTPINVIHLGDTTLTLSETVEFISSLKSEHSPEKYCIITNNCNHFSEKLANFLTGNSIPDYIKSAPTDISTEFLGLFGGKKLASGQ